MAAEVDGTPPKKLRFRTYLPRDESLKQHYEKLEDPETIVQNVVKDHERLIKESRAKLASTSTDLSKLAPKKPNWDLKRGVASKLDKLERRTQRAILELVRERAAEEEPAVEEKDQDVAGDGSNLANAVDQVGEGEEDSDLE